MSFPQSRYAFADMQHPTAWGFCDRCGIRYNLDQLVWQFDFRGNKLANLRILVCTRTCLDVPQDQLRIIRIGPDPVPVRDPRPGFQATQQGFTPTFSVLEIVDGDILPPPPNDDLGNDGGIVTLPANSTWPTEAAPGGFYNNGGAAAVTLPVAPNPLAPLVFFGTIGVNSANLLALGGAYFPDEDPAVAGAFWNNAGQLSISFGT